MSRNQANKISLLSIKTPILTASGWKAARDIKKGDVVFNFNGGFAGVLYTTPIKTGYVVYRLWFSDYSYIDGSVYTKIAATSFLDRDRKAIYIKKIEEYIEEAKRKSRETNLPWEMHLDKKIHYYRNNVENINKGYSFSYIKEHPFYKTICKSNFNIDYYKPRYFPNRNFDIPPYILGVWHSSGSRFRPIVNLKNRGYIIRNEIQKLGFEVKPALRHHKFYYKNHYSIKGLNKFITEKRMTKQKYIPREYLYCSEEQRLEYIRGYMDVFGHKNEYGHYTINFVDPTMLSHFVLLLHSLQIKCKVQVSKRNPVRGHKRKNLYKVIFVTDKKIITNLVKEKIHKRKSRKITKVEVKGRSTSLIGIVVDSSDGFLAGSTFIPIYIQNGGD